MAEQSLQALNHQRKEELWAMRIQQCRASGLSIQDWCAEQGLSHHTYYKWQSRLFHKYAEATENGFYEVQLSSPSKDVAVTVKIGQHSADVYNGADAQTIKAVLKAMKSC